MERRFTYADILKGTSKSSTEDEQENKKQTGEDISNNGSDPSGAACPPSTNTNKTFPRRKRTYRINDSSRPTTSQGTDRTKKTSLNPNAKPFVFPYRRNDPVSRANVPTFRYPNSGIQMHYDGSVPIFHGLPILPFYRTFVPIQQANFETMVRQYPNQDGHNYVVSEYPSVGVIEFHGYVCPYRANNETFYHIFFVPYLRHEILPKYPSLPPNHRRQLHTAREAGAASKRFQSALHKRSQSAASKRSLTPAYKKAKRTVLKITKRPLPTSARTAASKRTQTAQIKPATSDPVEDPLCSVCSDSIIKFFDDKNTQTPRGHYAASWTASEDSSTSNGLSSYRSSSYSTSSYTSDTESEELNVNELAENFSLSDEVKAIIDKISAEAKRRWNYTTKFKKPEDLILKWRL